MAKKTVTAEQPFKHERGITRWTIVQPGYRCMRDDCARPNAGNHGIAGEEWTYVVSDLDAGAALILTVLSHRFPAGVARPSADFPMGGPLSFHTLSRQYEGQEPRLDPCTWLGGKACYADAGFTAGNHFWKAHGRYDDSAQPDSFWLAMEQEFRERVTGMPK
jgi:hypothetical protein